MSDYAKLYLDEIRHNFERVDGELKANDREIASLSKTIVDLQLQLSLCKEDAEKYRAALKRIADGVDPKNMGHSIIGSLSALVQHYEGIAAKALEDNP